MIHKLSADRHEKPFRGPFTITRVKPGAIFQSSREDTTFGPLAIIDHAVMNKGLTIKMHEHVNDEILSYVWKGTIHHRDSMGKEVAISPGNLMLMNAGASFWHEEKVKIDHVEMLQVFFRPNEADLEPMIQFHKKEERNREWYVLLGPEGSDAPLHVRQRAYVLDAYPKKGDQLEVPTYQGLQPFLYVLDGKVKVQENLLGKMEAITDTSNPLPPITVLEDTTLILFMVDINAPMSLAGTISGISK